MPLEVNPEIVLRKINNCGEVGQVKSTHLQAHDDLFNINVINVQSSVNTKV